jgi:hypothetical protein
VRGGACGRTAAEAERGWRWRLRRKTPPGENPVRKMMREAQGGGHGEGDTVGETGRGTQWETQ